MDLALSNLQRLICHTHTHTHIRNRLDKQGLAEKFINRPRYSHCNQMKFIFQQSSLWFTHFFHQCCSACIPLVKKVNFSVHPHSFHFNSNQIKEYILKNILVVQSVSK